MKIIQQKKSDFVANKKVGKIYVSDFTDKSGKIMSIVVDEINSKSISLYKTSRTEINATYIVKKDQIVSLEIQKFEINDGEFGEPIKIRLDTKNLATLQSFVGFLLSADLKSISSGSLSFNENIILDPTLDSKLQVLAKDENGKKHLIKLLDEGYLTFDLDIPDLIKKGLSSKKIEEKKQKLQEFKKLLELPGVKEV